MLAMLEVIAFTLSVVCAFVVGGVLHRWTRGG
jgi:hypothetical protein